ncbi:oxidoreductase [Terriglobus roseus]|uniref:Predicted dehydrogenase n=1 Tax=Terriglobus roseus TaxID=392734 RepID=A0A1H4M647_9BACT|nr:oxidoreductase [Terriglobus roseus]SEB77882.1 Predicted dehydrogenase [Terriglobus roseus]
MKSGSNSRYAWSAWILAAMFGLGSVSGHAQSGELRFGIVGTDSTHAVEFTRILNDSAAKDHVSGGRVTAAYRGGSATLSISRDRIAKLSDTLQHTWSIPFVASIRDLCVTSDALLLLSVDVSVRLKEVEEAARCGKPIFIDKPLAGSLADAIAVVKLLDARQIPWFSSSSLRYGHEQRPQNLTGAETWGPGKYIDGFPLDLTYYGIHSIESLFSLMGPGVVEVAQSRTGDTDILRLTWSDGRIGTVRLIHPESTYGAVLFKSGAKAELMDLSSAYGPLVEQIVRFARSGRPPIPERETLEIFQVMDAAQQSLERGGASVHIPVVSMK